MSLAPVVMKMYIETDPGDPSNARKITGCAESGKTGRAHRIVFTTSQPWTVPAGVKSAFVTMAGGGGSGLGWRVLNAIHSGHSGGYVFSHPVDLVPGEVMTVTVGLGGRGHQTINTMVAATPGPPYFIYSNPPDDGLGGYPGSSSRLISPSLGTLLECAGGSGANIGGIDSFTGTKVAGDLPGAIVGSGAPAFPSPNRAAVGAFATASGPGACGLDNYGIGNPGTRQWGATPAGPPSGSYAGGITPFGYGSGGSINRSGCYVTSTLIGTCTDAFDGRDGVVMLDLWY